MITFTEEDKNEINNIITMLESNDEETQMLARKLVQKAKWYKQLKPASLVYMYRSPVSSYGEKPMKVAELFYVNCKYRSDQVQILTMLHDRAIHKGCYHLYRTFNYDN